MPGAFAGARKSSTLFFFFNLLGTCVSRSVRRRPLRFLPATRSPNFPQPHLERAVLQASLSVKEIHVLLDRKISNHGETRLFGAGIFRSV